MIFSHLVDARPIATFDVTERCPLECRHCYVPFPRARDASAAWMIEGFRRARDAHDIRSAFWLGGEPLLRPDVLRAGIALFERNAVATSGCLPIPHDLDAGLLVSIDGQRAQHDALRGAGAFDLALRHVEALAPGTFALSTTLTARTLDAIEELPALVERTRALGALIGFYVGRPGDPLRVEGGARDDAIDRLHELAGSGILIATPASLELMRPARSGELSRGCIYRQQAVAFDVQLEQKKPCTFGVAADCNACGCGVVAMHVARRNGDQASQQLLSALFPKRTSGFEPVQD